MARYIDAEKLEKEGWSASRTYPQDAHTMVYETKKMTDFPTADVVEVVRCRKCKWRDESTCIIHGAIWKDNDFCSQGEKKEDD